MVCLAQVVGRANEHKKTPHNHYLNEFGSWNSHLRDTLREIELSTPETLNISQSKCAAKNPLKLTRATNFPIEIRHCHSHHSHESR